MSGLLRVTRVLPLPLALALALGMFMGCSPKPGGATEGDSSSTGPVTSTSTDASATTDRPTTSESTGGSTDPVLTSTDPVLTSTSTTSTTTSSESTGGPSSSGDGTTGDGTTGDDTTGSGCVALMQGFTDPPVPSGWEKCGDLLPHRVSAEVCQVPAVPSNCPFDKAACKTDADCQGVPFGSCQVWVNQLNCSCVAGCETDADCEPGEVCRCAGDVLGPTSTCVPSTCESDAACGDQRCQFALSEGQDCGAQVIDGGCITPNDMCDSDLDCEVGKVCSPDGRDGLWLCQLTWCD